MLERHLNPRLTAMYEATRTHAYYRYRKGDMELQAIYDSVKDLPPYECAYQLVKQQLDKEEPVIVPGETFAFTRTRTSFPWRVLTKFNVENLSPDWELLLQYGTSGRKEAARQQLVNAAPDSEEAQYLDATIRVLTAVEDFAERYAAAADACGETAQAELLRRVPKYPAQSMKEAIQSIYFVFSILRLMTWHIGFARMDQYLLPIYQRDLASGTITRQQAIELIEEFFIMLNRDNDQYGAMQIGDDGESLMLGGCLRDGSSAYNDLTMDILDASLNVSMINPKINLRVDSNTPDDILLKGVSLTARGLGFPQYENDEVVIPSLVHFGYPLEDARDYSVAACWEYVVKDGRDTPNIDQSNLALATDRAIRKALREKLPWEALLADVRPEIRREIKKFPCDTSNPTPCPLFSAFSGKCIERGKDILRGGGSHYHMGVHGCASSTAADSLAAVKKWVYDEHAIDPDTYLDALEKNFDGYDDIRDKLLNHSPKVGNNDAESNYWLTWIFDAFADVIESIPQANSFAGSRVRPGTGSAMNYVLMTQYKDNPQYLKATADGRKEGEFISSSLAPSPGVRARGLLSVFETYGKLNYERLNNGGPITVELSPAFFRTPDALKKTVQFIRAFVKTGCQQLQINVLDHDVLRDAQLHPEAHRDLIVRVWGWSGYFVELDKPYQDQIIGRTAYNG